MFEEKENPNKFEALIYSNPLEFKPTEVSFDQYNGFFTTYNDEILEATDFVLISGQGKKYKIFVSKNNGFEVTKGRKYKNIKAPDEIYLDMGFLDEEGHRTLYKVSSDLLGELLKGNSVRLKQESEKIRSLNSEYFQELERQRLVRRMEDVYISPQEDGGIKIPKLGHFKREQVLTDENGNSVIAMRHSRLDFGRNFILALVPEPVPSDEVVYYQTGAGTLRRIVEDTDPFFEL
ncbi:MAG: hypothetical protein GTN76_06625 [Candidatus Aenigmarchaeota archaeon]|nr:hypothetical protein [Candidatus Aenigmarchaeota archaeon]